MLALSRDDSRAPPSAPPAVQTKLGVGLKTQGSGVGGPGAEALGAAAPGTSALEGEGVGGTDLEAHPAGAEQGSWGAGAGTWPRAVAAVARPTTSVSAHRQGTPNAEGAPPAVVSREDISELSEVSGSGSALQLP